ncbi:hypothetical protein K1T73_07205 [Roseovarius sp. SCSIO 43702]|uniref:hypothetical protein n=1 Tax=Roseovarius sp. SCSIO 43702 TaxID=2823043 RepID=UPI001C73927F|nr:hypothetical protein [Roseovarius sp. SCSIO 43702]QYX58143.1 hypothetical protein K1T73_07205 [Roseovarius sp. SCSIO 43702]
MRLSRPLLPALALSLAACTQFPEVDASISDTARAADYPALVPLDTLKARMDAPSLDPASARDLDTRAARLKARAAALQRRSVIDPATRERMRRGVQP